MKTVRHRTRYRHAQQRLRQGLSAKASAGRRRPGAGRRRGRTSAKTTGRKGRALINYCAVGRVRLMCVEIHPVGTDRVLGSAYLDGLGLIERSDDDRRLAEKVHRLVVWHCEED